MAEESWNEARLIPTSGINGSDEAERRATSALLAVMGAVKEFGRALVQPLGAPAGALLTYIEVPFEVAEKKVYPDGLLRVSRGQKTWTALVEVKTGTNDLQRDQLETYLEIARSQGYQCLITISNQIPPASGTHPTTVDKRLLRKVELHHWSWSQVLHAAVMQKEHRGVADPDQAWILGELIRYLEHPRSGALEFDDMGAAWVGVREAVSSGTLRRTDKGLADTTAKFEALLRFTSLRLGRSLGTEVTPALSRREQNEPGLRAQQLADSLVTSGKLGGGIRIPGAVAPLEVEVDLRSGRVSCSVDLEAPREGRQLTRVNWLLRQLKHAPDDVRVEATSARSRGPGAVGLLSTVRADPSTLVDDPQRDLRSFRISRTTPMGTKRGRGRGSFIDSVMSAVEDFYGDVVQHLKAWSAAPPRLREAVEELPTQSALDSNALSSQDGADEVEEDRQEPDHHGEPATTAGCARTLGPRPVAEMDDSAGQRALLEHGRLEADVTL